MGTTTADNTTTWSQQHQLTSAVRRSLRCFLLFIIFFRVAALVICCWGVAAEGAGMWTKKRGVSSVFRGMQHKQELKQCATT